jgi:hypothetical protein
LQHRLRRGGGEGAGWDAIGIDLNPSAIEFGQTRGSTCARSHSKMPISRTRASMRCRCSTFSSTCWIRAHAARLHPLAAPRRHRLSYVPNYDSASRLLMGKEAHFIWPTHHLNYYTPVTIAI